MYRSRNVFDHDPIARLQRFPTSRAICRRYLAEAVEKILFESARRHDLQHALLCIQDLDIALVGAQQFNCIRKCVIQGPVMIPKGSPGAPTKREIQKNLEGLIVQECATWKQVPWPLGTTPKTSVPRRSCRLPDVYGRTPRVLVTAQN
jgi:hypothetical protein